MPLALFIFGVLFLTAAVRGKHEELFGLLKDDFTGPNNFLYWGLSIFAITGVGYYKPLRPVSNAFLVLVVFALFLSMRKNGQDFFGMFMSQIGASTGPQLRDSAAIKGLEVDFGPGSLSIDLPKSIFAK
jgi:hypothetical protein